MPSKTAKKGTSVKKPTGKVTPKVAKKLTSTAKPMVKSASAKPVVKTAVKPVEKKADKKVSPKLESSKLKSPVVSAATAKASAKVAQERTPAPQTLSQKSKLDKANMTDKLNNKISQSSGEKTKEKAVEIMQPTTEFVAARNSGKSSSEVVKEASGKTAKKSGKVKVDKSLLNLSEKSLGELQKKWSEYHDKFGAQKAPLYDMSKTFEAAAPLQHKVLGWGFVVSVQNDRLEVLFESGSKTLISNYRPR